MSMGISVNSNLLESLSTVQLARLLDLDAQGPTPWWSAADGTAALEHQLSSLLLPDVGDVPGAERGRLGALSTGRTMLQALTDGAATVELLEAIKQFARHVRDQPASPLRGAPATVIYYAAIAAGLTRGARITKLSDAALREGFHWAMEQAGTDELFAIFAQALRKMPK